MIGSFVCGVLRSGYFVLLVVNHQGRNVCGPYVCSSVRSGIVFYSAPTSLRINTHYSKKRNILSFRIFSVCGIILLPYSETILY